MKTVEVKLKALMLAGLAGDASAQRHLLSAASVRLRGYFNKRLGFGSPDVEDLVQECLIAIHQRRDSYNPSLPFTAWLHAIARYKLIDHYRRRGVRKHMPLDDVESIASADETAAVLSGIDVESLLDSLPPKHQQAIKLTKIDGYSVEEAAAISGQSPSGIKIGVHRGIKRLAARVRGTGK